MSAGGERPYYADKLASLRDIFGASEVRAEARRIVVDGREGHVLINPDAETESVKDSG